MGNVHGIFLVIVLGLFGLLLHPTMGGGCILTSPELSTTVLVLLPIGMLALISLIDVVNAVRHHAKPSASSITQ